MRAEAGSMTRIFISYRRDDSAGSTWRLFDWCERQFGTDRVFFDRESIPPGEPFPRRLEDGLAACDVLLAVIGPHWATIADAGGQPRLWAAGDFVAHELATGLALRKRVIPVLVEGAAMPAREALPAALRPLADCEALALDAAHFRDDFERLVDAVLGRPRGFVRRRVDEVQRLLRFAARGAVVVPLVVLLAFLAAWLGLFGLLGLDTRIASYSMALAGEPTVLGREDRVLVVALDDDSERRLGRAYDGSPAWRELHAQLIDRLSAAGAAVIVLDFFLERESPADAMLVAALSRARQRGSRVVFAVKQLDDGRPRLAPALLNAGAEWGVACLGEQEGYLFAMPLARAVDRQRAANPFTMLDAEPAEAPALALTAVFGGTPDLIRRGPREITLRSTGPGVAPVGFSEIRRRARSHCPALADDDVIASRLLWLSPLDDWRAPARRHAYARWLETDASAAEARGRLVIVGIATSSALDEHSVRRGLRTEDRFGVELQADAMRSLLVGSTLRPPGWAAQLGGMVVLALAGGVTAFFLVGRSRAIRMLVPVAVVLAYLAFSASILAAAGVLLNPLYDVGAFLAAFLLLGRLERKAAGVPIPGGGP